MIADQDPGGRDPDKGIGKERDFRPDFDEDDDDDEDELPDSLQMINLRLHVHFSF